MKISKYNIIKHYDDEILVYNSYTKASIFLDKNSDTKMFEDITEFEKLDEEQKKLLAKNGFVVNDDRDELSEIKYMYEQKYFDNGFLNIILVPTLSCNFNCPYCFEKNYNCSNTNVTRYYEILTKFAKNHFKNYRNVQISLFGGEPLLCISESLKFLEWVKKDSVKNHYEYHTSIVTNGSLLTKSIIQKLCEHNLKLLQITIDSDRDTHDKLRVFKNGNPSFDLLINIINNVVLETLNDDCKFVLRINLNNTNVKKVEQTLKKIDKNNRVNVNILFRAIYNTHAYSMENKNSLKKLLEYYTIANSMGFKIYKDKYLFQTCEACGDRKMFYLLPDLTMRKCVQDLGYNGTLIGKINNDGEPELDVNNIVLWYKNCMSAFLDKDCLNCKKLPDCLGGCPLYKCKHNKKSCRTFDMACLPYIY